MKETKVWVVTIELELDADSHPRKFIADCITECLHENEDINHIKFVCLD